MPYRRILAAGALCALAVDAAASCGAAFCTVNTDWATQGGGPEPGHGHKDGRRHQQKDEKSQKSRACHHRPHISMGLRLNCGVSLSAFRAPTG